MDANIKILVEALQMIQSVPKEALDKFDNAECAGRQAAEPDPEDIIDLCYQVISFWARDEIRTETSESAVKFNTLLEALKDYDEGRFFEAFFYNEEGNNGRD